MGQYTALQVGFILNASLEKSWFQKNKVQSSSVFHISTQIGPHAVNLAGGQAASMRIAKDIVHYQKQNREQDPQIGQVKSRIEEYIKQMEGLFWL